MPRLELPSCLESLRLKKAFWKTKRLKGYSKSKKISRPLLGERLVEMDKITSEDLGVLLKKFKKDSKNRKNKSKSRS